MARTYKDAIVYIDGKYCEGSEAKISVWDHGLLHGDAIYDTARLYDGQVFKLDEHIDRLFDSAKGLDIRVPVSKPELKQIVLEVIRRNKIMNAQIRMIVTRGFGPPGLNIKGLNDPTLIASAVEVAPMLGREPLRLIVSSVRRKAPLSVDSKIKSVNYIDSILAKIQATHAGVDDAVMLDSHGFVSECTGANIFAFKNGRLSTPPTTSALPGITRVTMLELASGMGVPTYEGPMTVQDLYTADEVFITGTGVDGAIPVREVDGRKIGAEAPGPITKKLSDAYVQLTRTKHLTPVYE